MKYITFTIPCYNSENYMRRCVDSLLVGGEDVEILIIDDGSSDRTGAIADEYEMLYPNIVKAVHKPNGGHGSGVTKGWSWRMDFIIKSWIPTTGSTVMLI